MSYASWDPTGKLLLTASDHTKTFFIWNCFGKLIFKDSIIKDIKNIDWRPRPKIQIAEKKL